MGLYEVGISVDDPMTEDVHRNAQINLLRDRAQVLRNQNKVYEAAQEDKKANLLAKKAPKGKVIPGTPKVTRHEIDRLPKTKARIAQRITDSKPGLGAALAVVAGLGLGGLLLKNKRR